VVIPVDWSVGWVDGSDSCSTRARSKEQLQHLEQQATAQHKREENNPHLTNRTLLRAHLARQHRLLWHPHLLLLRLGKTHIRLALLRCLCHDGFGGWVLGRRGEIEGGAALRK